MISSILYNFIRFIKNTKGIAILEFSLILPLLLTILIGSIELSNAVYMSQKNQTASIVTANLVADLSRLNTDVIEDIAKISTKMMSTSTTTSTQFGLVMTIIQMSNSSNSTAPFFPFIVYQQKYGDAALIKSEFTYNPGPDGKDVDNVYVQNNKINLTKIDNYGFNNNEQIIIVETGYKYNPINFNKITESIMGSDSMVIPYKTIPIIPRISRFKFLPHGGAVD